MTNVWNDLRYALRQLRKSPGFTLTIIVLVGLAIAATATVFSIADVVLLRPLPFAHSDQLLMPWEHHPLTGREEVAYPDYIDWRNQNHVFDGLAAYTSRSYSRFALSMHGKPTEEIEGTLASANLFSVLQVKPTLGRGFLPQEETPGKNHVVILSHRIWQNRFASNPNILGQSITINGEPYTVIGILSPQLAVPAWADLWVPLPTDISTSRAQHMLEVLGRKKLGVSIAQVQADMQTIVSRLQAEYPITNKPTGFLMITLTDHIVGNVRAAIWSLAVAAFLVLLMTCANVANLLLVKGIAAQKEIAVRSALGASRSRLILPAFTENLLLTGAGILFGLYLSQLLLHILRTQAVNILPRARELALSPIVCAVTAFLCLGITVLSGVAPCLRMIRRKALDPLKHGSRSSASVGQLRLQRSLLRIEMALAVVVLIGTGLLLKSFRNLLQVDTGFRTAHILTMHVTLPPAQNPQQPNAEGDVFYERLLPQLRQLPGVQEAATVNITPLTHSIGTRFAVADTAMPADGHFPVAQVRVVSPGYFSLLGIRAWSGRLFTRADCGPRSNNILINRSMAEKYFHTEDASGRGVLQGFFYPPLRRMPIIGVATDTKDTGLETATEPTIYFCDYARSSTLLVKTLGDPNTTAHAVEKQIRVAEPDAGIGDVQTMNQIIQTSLAPNRISLYLFTIFGCFGLLITSAGVSAVLSYSLAQRKKEIAVRIAVGATRGDLAEMVLRNMAAILVPGLAIGLLLSTIFSRAMASMLFHVAPTDMQVFVAVPVVLVVAALATSILPLRRAVMANPIEALRSE